MAYNGASLLLALVHLTVGQLHLIKYIPRSRYLSVAGGISVAYVCLHILPDLEKHQDAVTQEINTGILSYLSHHIYIATLLGLIIFYSMEKLAIKAQQLKKEKTNESSSHTNAFFWVHVVLFFFYYAMIGYLLVYQSENGWLDVIMFMLVMAPHVLAIDFSLRFHHEKVYDKYGRWILAAAMIIGTALGNFAKMPDEVFAFFFCLYGRGNSSQCTEGRAS